MKKQKPTKLEQARLDAIHNMPCICCKIGKKLQPSPTEAHHIVDGGYRKHSGGHMATIPLCGWHHRADIPTFCLNRKRDMFFRFGPSLKYQSDNPFEKGGFEAAWGSERALLKIVNYLIEDKE